MVAQKTGTVPPMGTIDMGNRTDADQPMPNTLKGRLNRYGSRAWRSAGAFLITLRETVTHIGTALAGSIVLLPVVILVRGIHVLLFTLAKTLVLSLFRAVCDLLQMVIKPLYLAFSTFNKRVLFPLLKRIREDDAFALAAFVIMLIVVGSVVFAVTRIIH